VCHCSSYPTDKKKRLRFLYNHAKEKNQELNCRKKRPENRRNQARQRKKLKIVNRVAEKPGQADCYGFHEDHEKIIKT